MREIKHAPFEACGWFVRTTRKEGGSGGWLIAKCESVEQPGEAHELFYAAHQALALIGAIPHGDNCFVSSHYEGDPGDRCNCGKDAAVAALDAAINKATGAQS
jgi:hypothetical protein